MVASLIWGESVLCTQPDKSAILAIFFPIFTGYVCFSANFFLGNCDGINVIIFLILVGNKNLIGFNSLVKKPKILNKF